MDTDLKKNDALWYSQRKQLRNHLSCHFILHLQQWQGETKHFATSKETKSIES